MTDICSGDQVAVQTNKQQGVLAITLITCRCLMSLLMAAVMTGEASLPSFMLAFSVER
uniref:Uncharacterized protein n=1 Tax=Oreochromis niloticus TaxID=8128 RepID=A0A669D8N6_ORENI